MVNLMARKASAYRACVPMDLRGIYQVSTHVNLRVMGLKVITFIA